MLYGCGHTTELNRDLASKSRLTSNHDLANNRDLIYFLSDYKVKSRFVTVKKLSIMRKHGQTTSVVLYVTQNDFAANFCSSKQFIYYSFLQSFASVQSFFHIYQRDRLGNLR